MFAVEPCIPMVASSADEQLWVIVNRIAGSSSTFIIGSVDQPRRRVVCC